MKKEKICWLSLFGGVFFAFCMALGLLFSPAGDRAATIELSALWACLPPLALMTGLFYFCLHRLFHRDFTRPDTVRESRPAALLRQHPFLVSFAVVLLAWIPYLALCYPGNVSFDGARQMRQALGTEELTNQHPVLGTLLIGLFFRMGEGVSDNFGVFTIVMAQTLLTAAAVGLFQKKIIDLTHSTRFAGISLAFFAINPIWGIYEETIVKDVPFTALFMLYSLSYLELAEQVLDRKRTEPLNWKKGAFLAVTGALCCMIRHGESIVIAMSMAVMVLFAAREKWKTAVLMVVTVALAVGGNKALVAATDAGSPPTRATYSLFFQQTALYMQRYPEDVTPEEYAAIDAILDAGAIGELYDPLISDPVKGTYKLEAGKKELIAYFKAWFRMFLRHPGVYFNSFLQFSYSYVDPFHCATEKRVFYYNFTKVEGVNLIYPREKTVRKMMKTFTNSLLAAPLLQLTMFPGTYFWINAACFMLMCHKRCGRQLAVFSLPALRVLMCLASPVSGYFRYALPLLAITPLMAAWARFNASEAKSLQQ